MLAIIIELASRIWLLLWPLLWLLLFQHFRHESSNVNSAIRVGACNRNHLLIK